MNERDPRIDPRPGDVLRLDWGKRGTKTRTVRTRGPLAGWPDGVTGTEVIRTPQPFGCYTMAGWRRWAKNAEVIHKAETL
jgi:hypothetical protein